MAGGLSLAQLACLQQQLMGPGSFPARRRRYPVTSFASDAGLVEVRGVRLASLLIAQVHNYMYAYPYARMYLYINIDVLFVCLFVYLIIYLCIY